MTPEDHAEVAAFEALPLDAQMLFGLWFGLGNPQTFTLTHWLKELKPAPRTQAALDVLVAEGFISLSPQPCGAKVYRPIKEARAAFAWVHHHMESDPEFRANAAGWRLMVPV